MAGRGGEKPVLDRGGPRAAKANLVVAEPHEDAQIGRIKSRGPLPRTKPSPYTQAGEQEEEGSELIDRVALI